MRNGWKCAKTPEVKAQVVQCNGGFEWNGSFFLWAEEKADCSSKLMSVAPKSPRLQRKQRLGIIDKMPKSRGSGQRSTKEWNGSFYGPWRSLTV